MIKPHVRKGFFATIGVVAVAAIGMVLTLGAKPGGKQVASFEYKVINQAKMFHESLRHVQMGSQASPDLTTQVTSALDSQANQVEDVLNDLAGKGWELVGFNEAFFVLKRPPRK